MTPPERLQLFSRVDHGVARLILILEPLPPVCLECTGDRQQHSIRDRDHVGLLPALCMQMVRARSGSV